MVDVENLEFKWGKKKGVGGRKRDVLFYESFTYDGEEYNLYDCVYFFKDDEPMPYVGKIIKIWENPDKTKKVKVVWFFQPHEIMPYLAAEETLGNELVLASGEGLGLVNINPLEAIAGKCNVICISKDGRNRQPSIEECQMADYVFYRTFDVGQRIVSDKIDERIAGIEAKYFFNREGFLKPSAFVQKSGGGDKEETSQKQVPEKADGDTKENLPVVHGAGQEEMCGQEVPEKPDGDTKDSLPVVRGAGQEESSGKQVPEKPDGDMKDGLPVEHGAVKEDTSGKQITEKPDGNMMDSLPVVREVGGQIAGTDRNDSLSGRKQIPEKPDGDMKDSLHIVDEVGRQIAGTDRKDSLSGLKCTSSSKIDSDVREDNLGKVVVDKVKIDGKLKLSKDPCDLDGRPHKKAKIADYVKVPDGAKRLNVQDFSRRDSDCNATKALAPNVKVSEDKSKLAKDSLGKVKSFSKELKTDDRLTKLSSEKLPKESSVQPLKENNKLTEHAVESIRKLDSDRSKWFKELPWEERMKNAHEQGSLLLFQNLDPTYTSADVEDIVRQAFNVTCTAKVIQRTAFSNPYYGQALVIFRTREAAEMVVTRLDKGCLLLPNGRPLVASIVNPSFPKKQSTFAGHLTLDKLKLQMQREMKEAVSTSHCSQPNTLEFDMAMEWCLLQERSDHSWKKLYELQEKEYRKLKAELKSK